MTTTADQEKLYICPGETHPISRSVHLSRLAAFYPGCRECPFRTETGHLAQQTVDRLQSTERRVERKSLFTAEGVRGVYLNELNRSRATEVASALACLLWEAAPLVGRCDSTRRNGRRPAPAVVVGHDERPSSPDIVTGVVRGLRRFGCQVIDIGLSTRPCFSFAAHHLQVTAGIFVTGSGRDPSWTGLDFVGLHGQPLSREDGSVPAGVAAIPRCLDHLEHRLTQPLDRPTRQAGPYRAFQAHVPYQAGLWKHFHALRPLRVAVAGASNIVRRTLEEIFHTLPCRLLYFELPTRARNPVDSEDADVRRLAGWVRQENAHLGLLIDDDAMRCGLVDELGQLVPPTDLLRPIAEVILADASGTVVCAETAGVTSLEDTIAAAGGRLVDAGTTLARMHSAMTIQDAVCGGGRSGRYWFWEDFPVCDAVLTLARVLTLLSQSDAPCSQVVQPATA